MTSPPQGIAAIFYDLDNCLFPTASFPLSIVNAEFDKLRALNQKEDFLPPEVLDRALQECWVAPMDLIADTYGFPLPLIDAAARLFSAMPVPNNLKPYEDISAITTFPGMRFLVTTGYRAFQSRKIAALDISRYFDAIHIDGLDDDVRKGKETLFRELIATHHLDTKEVIVIGDNPDSEIAAGNRIGLSTVQILRSGVKKGSNAHYYINNLFDLPSVIKDYFE